MAFFPTYKDNWTRTPNVFFDEILLAKGTTINEAKVIGYLIRHTLGYNRDAKWTAVSRKDLIEKVGISNGAISGVLAKCEEKGWIINYVTGEPGKEQRYIFLNDERNARIVEGLRRGCFTIQDLEYLNEAGIEALLERHGLHTPTETVEEQLFPYKNCRGTPTKTVEVPPTENVEVPSTKTVEVDNPQVQAAQEVSATLNTTNNKDKEIKTNKERQQLTVVVVREKIEEYFGQKQKLSDKHIKHLIDLAEIEEVDLMEMIQNTYEYYQATNEEFENLFGAIKHAILYGGWTIPVKSSKYAGLPLAIRMQLEAEESGEFRQLSEEELAERRARLQAKMKYMDETLSEKYGPRTNTQPVQAG